MNLKQATLFLITGSFYTVLHNTVFAVFPSLKYSLYVNAFLSMLWIAAAFALILFIIYFLKEVANLTRTIKIFLQLIILFTCIIILLKLISNSSNFTIGLQNTIFEIIRTLNSASAFIFLVAFINIIPHKSSLAKPVKLILPGFTIGLVLDFTALYYYFHFFSTGFVAEPMPFFALIAATVFIYNSVMVIYFLIKFLAVEDYSKILTEE